MKDDRLWRNRNNQRLMPLLLLFMLSILIFTPVSQGTEQGAVLPELHLGNAELRTVFRSLAEWGEFRILLASTVRGRVTLPLKPGLTAEETVELLAQMHGYSCHWVEGTALIGVDPTVLAARTPRQYQWSFVDEEAILAALTRVVPHDRLRVEAATKTVMVDAAALEDENMRELLAAVDREATSYLIEAELIEFDLNQLKEQGLSWALPGTGIQSSLRLTALPVTTGEQWSQYPGSKRLAGVRLRTESNRPGVVFLGDQYPVIISQPGRQTDLIEYQRIGVGIEATPLPQQAGQTDLEVVLTLSGIGGINQILLHQTLAPGETSVLSGLTFTGNVGEALILSPGQRGPSKAKTVCLFLTPKVGGDLSADIGTAPLVVTEGVPDGSEVIHVKIFSGDEPEVVTVNPPATQILTEVVGLEKPKSPGDEPAAPVGLPGGAPVEQAESIQRPTAGVKEAEASPLALRVAYRVVQGDTVFSIGRKYGIDPTVILQENAMASSDLLQVGQTIRIPIPPTHLYQLQPKETLWRIAQRYGTTVELLVEINSITDVTSLRSDQVIILPVPMDQVVNDKY